MDYTFTATDESPAAEPEAEPLTTSERDGFSLSSQPLVRDGTQSGPQADELPRSYGRDTVRLLARDPHSVFAYWDVDWATAFGGTVPRERKVHLRLLCGDGSVPEEIEVEPLASGRIVQTTKPDAPYTAELGYYDGAGEWRSIARSLPVNTPPATAVEELTGEFMTVPFHLSFQKMLDALAVTDEAPEPLTRKLSDLRQRAENHVGEFTAAQRELVGSIDELIAQTPPPQAEAPAANVRWTHDRLVRILASQPTSPNSGFGGSSRAA